MNRKEQEIKDLIDEKVKQIEIPETLSPERMQKKLEQIEAEKRKKQRRRRYYWMSAAACAVLAIGILSIGKLKNTEQVALENTEQTEEIDTIPTAKDYDEIYAYVKNVYEEQDWEIDIPLFGAGVAREESADSVGNRGIQQSQDYSTTNVRQEGVDEADTAKTDGRYLYVLKDNNRTVSIVDTKNNMKVVSNIEVGEEDFIHEFYVLADSHQLVILYAKGNDASSEFDDDALYMGNSDQICVFTYDVSDVKQPKKMGELTQSGNYTSSRISEGYLYLFSSYNVNTDFREDDPDSFVPYVGARKIAASDVYLPEINRGCMYEIVTSISLEEPEKIVDTKAIFTEGGELYVSNENIYYYETNWGEDNESETTTIRKISYEKGKLNAVARCKLNGYLEDSFSIDEYEGYLRMVMTVGETNSVYVMDEKLKMTGKIEGLAKDERIYSARFFGETGYFVTFRETDPLFTVDLSNPKDPKIIGKLKIPGFSEYLHFYGENHLLGIGMNVDEEGITTDGMKLTMFDISDKTNVKEEATYLMENVYSADVTYDYKAGLINAERNIIGFAAYPEGCQNYYLFHYDKEKGFVCDMEEEINGNASRSARGLYIGDTLYVIQGNVIESYDLMTYEKNGELIL